MSDVLEQLAALHAHVDAAASALSATHRERMQCKRGCFGCCADDLTVFEVEAERIRRHASLVLEETPHPPGRCAFLDADGACRIYEVRPYVCRTQGLPLRWLDHEAEAEYRDICELNDSPSSPPVETLDESECWTIGPYEAELARLEELWDGGTMRRVKLRELFVAPAHERS